MSKPLPALVIEGAIEILSDPNRWCQGILALDAKGRAADNAFAKDAARFCAVGALLKSAYDLTGDRLTAGLLISDAMQCPIVSTNDRKRGDDTCRLEVISILKSRLEKIRG